MQDFRSHEVVNQPPPLEDTNLFTTDEPLFLGIQRVGAGWARERLEDFGALAGSARFRELGRLANHHGPELRSHDRFGHRIDEVEFHPAWHELMGPGDGARASTTCRGETAAGRPRGAQAALHSFLAQVEAGHELPASR